MSLQAKNENDLIQESDEEVLEEDKGDLIRRDGG